MENFFTSGVLILLPVIFSCIFVAIKHVDGDYCWVIIDVVLTDVAVDMAWQKKKKKEICRIFCVGNVYLERKYRITFLSVR